MARTLGSWWIKDGIDGRRIEAQGFASLLDGLSGYDWTEDHGTQTSSRRTSSRRRTGRSASTTSTR